MGIHTDQLVECTIVDWDMKALGASVGEVIVTSMSFPRSDFNDVLSNIRNRIINGEE